MSNHLCLSRKYINVLNWRLLNDMLICEVEDWRKSTKNLYSVSSGSVTCEFSSKTLALQTLSVKRLLNWNYYVVCTESVISLEWGHTTFWFVGKRRFVVVSIFRQLKTERRFDRFFAPKSDLFIVVNTERHCAFSKIFLTRGQLQVIFVFQLG